MKNLKEFKALADRYTSMTIEEIRENAVYYGVLELNPLLTLNKLTGFGYNRTCTLCIVVGKIIEENGIEGTDCDSCAWKVFTGRLCTLGVNEDTYLNILAATDIWELLAAVHERGDYMETLIERDK
jgi:hypothetical protein